MFYNSSNRYSKQFIKIAHDLKNLERSITVAYSIMCFLSCFFDSPVKLNPFVDNWIQTFLFHGESKSSAKFGCDTKITKWKLSWKDVVGSKAIIVRYLFGGCRVHSTIGLSVVGLQGLDNETILVFVEERLSKSEHCIIYGLIFDLSKFSIKQCESLTTKRYIFFPKDTALWTPQHIQEQWDEVDKVQSNSVCAAPVPI